EGGADLVALERAALLSGEELEQAGIESGAAAWSRGHGHAEEAAVEHTRQLARGNARSGARVLGLGGHDVEQDLEAPGGDAPLVDGAASIPAVRSVAEESEQGLDDGVAGGKEVDLLLLHRRVSPEGAEDGALLAEFQPGQRLDLQSVAEVERAL